MTKLIVLVAICLLPTVFGCSCIYPPPYSTPLESLCMDYQRSSDVFTARVINASCNCIPPHNDSSYGPANISCLSSDISEYFTTEVVSGATCDAGIQTYGVLSCDMILNKFKPIECPYEGQVFMDCAPLCPTTCSNKDVASPCPRVCVRGCGCPEGKVIDEEQRRCIIPSQCPNKICPLVGQVTTLCVSSCPQDCFRPGNESCVKECDECACPPPTIADYITGECVQPEQCTACPIEGQVYKKCGSSCPRTCDNVKDIFMCTYDCWQGCECPSGMVIDVERRRCVEYSQCVKEPPTITTRISENGKCAQQFICPFNTPQNDYYAVCQYILEVTEVFKGDIQVGQIITDYGPDLVSSCGNSQNILSVGTTYVVGIGGPCSAYKEWTPYSQYPTEHRQALSNSCGISASVTITPSSTSPISSSSVVIETNHSATAEPTTTVQSDNNEDDDSVSGAVIGAATAVGIMVLIIIVLLFVVILFYWMRKKSRKAYDIDNKDTTVNLYSKVTKDDQQHTRDTAGQPQSTIHDKNVSQKVKGYPVSRVEIANESYISTEHNQVGRKVPIIPNPSYAVTSKNSLQTRKTSEKEYDYVQTENKHDKFGYLELTRSAPSRGVRNQLTDPANDDNINIDLNPSYSLPQGRQGVKLEDNPCYTKLNYN